VGGGPRAPPPPDRRARAGCSRGGELLYRFFTETRQEFREGYKVRTLMRNLCFLFLLCPMVGCQPMKQTDDELLVKKIREAIAKNTAVDRVEEFVGVEAAINTLRDVDRRAFRRADYDDDPESPEKLPKIKQAKHVVYWVRLIGSKNPRVVGVLWTEKNEMKLFFGIVLPP
jgi:hypothetical protein